MEVSSGSEQGETTPDMRCPLVGQLPGLYWVPVEVDVAQTGVMVAAVVPGTV